MEQDRFLLLVTRELQVCLTPEEHAELRAMLRASPELAAQRKILLQFWSSTRNEQASQADTARAFDRLVQESRAQGDESWTETLPIKRRSNRKWWAAAAAIFLLASIGGELWLNRKPAAPTVFSSKHNDKGNRSLILLPDGSKVWLNAASDLQYPEHFDGNQRKVTLTGEAFFEIAHDASHPFIIHTRKMDVRVLGTSFNIKAYPEEATSEATLVTGSIEVHIKDRPEGSIRLKPNEKLVIANNNSDSERVIPLPQLVISKPTYLSLAADADSAMVETAWVQNKLMFKEEAFASLAKRMEKWYNVTFVFRNKDAAQLTFTGVFTSESLAAALHALQLTEPFHYQVKGSEVIIY